ncbi:hypothetical protein QE417_001550 [Mucilaginibacter terrae]|uniref:Uncharacterized protein n=1 Tax=Mucilaginibacter terrae TaxID=1955052 RepID=A0ABU3GRS0_9SPHI|nr:hypothetical protein [Mucilaginibacter terrae]
MEKSIQPVLFTIEQNIVLNSETRQHNSLFRVQFVFNKHDTVNNL